MSATTLFITGTDTGIGKTRASTALIRLARARGIDAVGFKPVAAGCDASAEGWRNDDALQLLAAGDGVEAYEAINPTALPVPITPLPDALKPAQPTQQATAHGWKDRKSVGKGTHRSGREERGGRRINNTKTNKPQTQYQKQ